MNLAKTGWLQNINKIKVRPGLFFGLLILIALLAFEMFNYSTTDFALRDLLGELKFAGMHWATILAIAFCGIDFAGIARLFTPQTGAEEPKEVWYLFGAWLLAATMNAMLTWWGVSMAVASHALQSSAVLDPEILLKAVPVFVALMVWVIRILIIGTISTSGERLFRGEFRRSPVNAAPTYHRPTNNPVRSAALENERERPAPSPILSPRPSIVRPSVSVEAASRQEPTYHSVSMAPRNNNNNNGAANRQL